MDVFLTVTIFALFAPIGGLAGTVFDVMKYGAVGDGVHDDTQAFLKAWAATCTCTSANPSMNIPSKTFLISPLQFNGPCKSSTVNVQILGKIIAPTNIKAWQNCAKESWIYFSQVNNLIVSGSGQIDGQGSSWWGKGYSSPSCGIPKALHFFRCDNLQLTGLTHLNPPKSHIGIDLCKQVFIGHLHISAPETSPNTDGIDISSSSLVQISNLDIQTGDDCIAVNSGCSFINITDVHCGPGHGISVGSLGQSGSTAQVENVHVRNCNFTKTQNGCRIKTWPGGTGYARSITFDQINLNNVQNPIIIDQHYCGGSHCGEQGKAVAISDVTFSYISGSSATKDAINLNCSSKVPCKGIVMNHVTINGNGVFSSCNSASGNAVGTSPQVPCLSK